MVAFGRTYLDLAYRAAESLILHNPGLEIDLFTEAAVDPGPFSRVHVLPDIWIRSKVDAMRLSRFDRTLYLDADTRVLADLRDIFEVLDRFDIALAQDQNRNSPQALTEYRQPFPNAFPQFNAGVIGFRRTPKVTALLDRWTEAIRDHAIDKDQPSLRELLWNSDLQIGVLPREYNLWDLTLIDHLVPRRHTAPRIVHSNLFVTKPPPRPGKDALSHYIGTARTYKLGLLLAADHTLARRAGSSARLPSRAQNAWLRLLYLRGRAERQIRRALACVSRSAG